MIIGDKEVDSLSVNLRHKIKQQRYEKELYSFMSDLLEEINIEI